MFATSRLLVSHGAPVHFLSAIIVWYAPYSVAGSGSSLIARHGDAPTTQPMILKHFGQQLSYSTVPMYFLWNHRLSYAGLGKRKKQAAASSVLERLSFPWFEFFVKGFEREACSNELQDSVSKAGSEKDFMDLSGISLGTHIIFASKRYGLWTDITVSFVTKLYLFVRVYLGPRWDNDDSCWREFLFVRLFLHHRLGSMHKMKIKRIKTTVD